MMYCSVDEAFDNPVKQQLKEYEKQTHINNYKSSLIKSVEEEQHNKGIQPSYIQGDFNNNYNQTYFTAQGDYSKEGYNYTKNNGYNRDLSEPALRQGSGQGRQGRQESYPVNNNYSGTPVSELKKKQNKEVNYSEGSLDMEDIRDTYDSSDFNSFDSADFSLKSDNPNKNNHNYYINKFIQIMMDNNSDADMMSVTSSEDINMYNHIRICKYCRSQINQKMKQYYCQQYNTVSTPEQSNNKINVPEDRSLVNDNGSQQYFNEIRKLDKMTKNKVKGIKKNLVEGFNSFTTKCTGYELREIVIIILVGIIVIFLLDLFVKIGRKTIKLEGKQ